MDRIYVMELVRSLQMGQIGRREFVKRATVAIGSATAATALLTACERKTSDETPEPVVDARKSSLGMAQKDSEAGLQTEIASYPHLDDASKSLNGYLAFPDKDGSFPGIIVIQEWWGLDGHIKDVTRRLAREGYATLAPDLYHGAVTTEPDAARKLVMQLDLPNAVREIQSAITYLLSQSETKGPKVGIVGFCMGGRLVFETTLVENRLAAAVPFYGLLADPQQAKQVKAPLLGLYGALDQGIPVDKINAVQKALTESGIVNKFKIYDGAGHAFFNDTRPTGYNADTAKDAWKETLTWFKRYL
ncbi:dienelactone hydrolase family protein [Candidatus Acetothermia bacterium]|nr:dienelactone hydrolase family protein [Candidatus Acetothermia bacterium]MBI3643048.1 dienelactone hydrolase family protein [Candidatus Acetothermia bacterium]